MIFQVFEMKFHIYLTLQILKLILIVLDTEQLCQVEMEVDLMIKKLQTFLDKIQVHSVKSTKLQSIVNKSKGYFQTQLKDVAMVQDVSLYT